MAALCKGEMICVVSRESSRSTEECHLNAAIEFEDIIGLGAFSVVWRARQRDLGEVVAVKCVKCENSDHQEAIRREYRILQSFDTPTVVSALSLFEVSKTMSMYLCLEYCEWGNVYSHVKMHGPFRQEYACILFAQCMRGISYIHCRRIVHCDIKHQNLLLRGRFDDFALKIADFDTARRVGRAIRGKQICRGTREFKAPELVFHGEWNERIDIWAGGLCFYFLLTGHLPFDICSKEVAHALLIGMLPSATFRAAPTLGQHLLKQCLSVCAHDRPPALELSQHPVFDPKTEDRTCDDESESPGSCEHIPRAFAHGYHEYVDLDVAPVTRMIDSFAEICGRAVSSSAFRGLTVETHVRAQLSSFLSVDGAFRQLAHEKCLRAIGGLDREHDLGKRTWCIA
eukprot:TRINITY_DN29523_c0_g2_i1.p1 TRINITY_DN29523_c0_g2~~TRINITY_DN29523_c0_g2_i1.p1  ORF type:complete len:399 (+),score=41.95 TRINITY_DN29523_c0_g2_i1:168-1364(+)